MEIYTCKHSLDNIDGDFIPPKKCKLNYINKVMDNWISSKDKVINEWAK